MAIWGGFQELAQINFDRNPSNAGQTSHSGLGLNDEKIPKITKKKTQTIIEKSWT